MNRSSGFFSYGVAGLLLVSSLGLMGCPKKVPPAEGSAGLSKEGRPSDSTAQTEKPAEPGPASPRDGGVREERPPQSRPEEKLPPLAKSEPETGSAETGSAAGEGQPGPLQDIFFEFDQWVIQPETRTILERNARWLESNPQVKVQIEGHSDERGTDEYNLALGERRAKSAMNFLTNLGVNPSRVTFISYGEEQGFCNDKNEACYQKNRRAHFVVQK